MKSKGLVALLILLGSNSGSLSYSQSRSLANKLADKSKEQMLVFEVKLAELSAIVEATAWKMNYDSVVVSSSGDKILLIRAFPQSELQYRVLLQMAEQDSALLLTLQGFWLVPPDSIPRYNKSLKSASRDLTKLFLHALTQEIALRQGSPLYDRSLPDKPFHRFLGWNLLNPGAAAWYMAKDHPRISQKSAIGLSIFFGVLDFVYVTFYLSPEHNEPEKINLPLTDLSTRQLGALGIVTSRLAMTVGYFVDRDYWDLKKSGYYFPKLERLNLNTKYTKYLQPTKP